MPLPVLLSVDPARVGRWVLVACVFLEVSFVLLDYHVNYGRLTEVGAIRRLTNIAREDGLASWFATTQTLLVALTACAIWILVRAGQGRRGRRLGWLVVAAMFTYMAVDDGAQVHERLGTLSTTLSEEAGASAFDLFPSYAWQLLFVPLFGAFGLMLAAFMWYELRAPVQIVMVGIALGCFALAVGLDFVEGLDEDHPWNLYAWVSAHTDLSDFTMTRFRQTPYDTLEHFSRSIEEFLEMLANTLLWVAFILHVPSVASEVRIRFGASPTLRAQGRNS